jgi:DnaJ-class molecular chaperone
MEVILCNNCDGRGSFLVKDFDGAYERQCKKCCGTGRLLTKHYKIEIPFSSKPQQYLDADKSIIETIQKLNKIVR